MAEAAHDTLRPVNPHNDHSKEQDGGAVGTIKCLAVGIEWGIHPHPRHDTLPTLSNAQPGREMDRPNRRTNFKCLDFLSEGFDLLKAKTRSLISHTKKT